MVTKFMFLHYWIGMKVFSSALWFMCFCVDYWIYR